MRQTETAAIRKAGKALSGSTFQRAVVCIFTTGTLVDDDDPSFSDMLQKSSYSNTNQSEDTVFETTGHDDADHNVDTQGAGLYNETCNEPDSISSTGANATEVEDSCWLTTITELSELQVTSSETIISIVSIDIKAHSLRYESVICHDNTASRQQILDALDILQVI